MYSQFAAVNFPGTVFYKKDNYKVSIGTSSDFEGNKELPLDQIFPLSVRRAGSGSAPAEPSSQCLKPDVPEPNKVKSDDASYAKSFHLYEQGCYEEAAQTLLARRIRDPDDCKAMALLARVYANQGRLAEANRWCERALAADKLSPSCHILHATILKEQGAIAEATRALQRALYLDQNLILAHFALGNIARQQEKIQEATRHFDNARTLLGNCSPDQVLPEFDCMTAGRLMEILRSTFGAQVSVISDEQRARTSAAAAEKWLTASAREAPR